MQAETEKSLFDIKVNEDGIIYIRKTLKMATVILITLILLTVLALFFDIAFIFQITKAGLQSKVELISAGLRLIITVANFAGVFYYIRFIRKLNKAIYLDSDMLFNNSFKDFYYNVMIFSFVIFLNLVNYGIFILNIAW